MPSNWKVIEKHHDKAEGDGVKKVVNPRRMKLDAEIHKMFALGNAFVPRTK